MHFNHRGFTVKEFVAVIFSLVVLVAFLAPSIIRSTGQVMLKAHAAADAASLRSTVTNVAEALLDDKTMTEISQSLDPVHCETDPNADLWLNYSRPITLDAYFVDGDNYYSIDYLSELALNGSTDLDVKEPFTLGFWYQAGSSN